MHLVAGALDMNRSFHADDQLGEDEIQRRMEAGIRRALSTPPKPTSEIVGKSERAAQMRESRVRKASRVTPKSP
jgi:hypothetical protein